jgi:hypothetical protein
MARKPGRPSKYTDELATTICERIAEGESLRRICSADDMPDRKTILRWLADERNGFAAKYAHARNLQAEAMDELIHDIGDGVLTGLYDPHAAKVALGAYQWRASKLAPKKYGDRVAVAGVEGEPVKTHVTIELVDKPDSSSTE